MVTHLRRGNSETELESTLGFQKETSEASGLLSPAGPPTRACNISRNVDEAPEEPILKIIISAQVTGVHQRWADQALNALRSELAAWGGQYAATSLEMDYLVSILH